MDGVRYLKRKLKEMKRENKRKGIKMSRKDVEKATIAKVLEDAYPGDYREKVNQYKEMAEEDDLYLIYIERNQHNQLSGDFIIVDTKTPDITTNYAKFFDFQKHNEQFPGIDYDGYYPKFFHIKKSTIKLIDGENIREVPKYI